MKSKFQLTAIVVALTSVTGGALAATTNTTNNFLPGNQIVSGDTIPTRISSTPVGSIGFSQQSVINPTNNISPNANATMQKYDAGNNGNPFNYTLYTVTSDSGKQYYTDVNGTGELNPATPAEIAAIGNANLNFTGDKTGQVYTNTVQGTTSNTNAVVNQNQISYSSSTNQSTSTVVGAASLTNTPNTTPANTPDPTSGTTVVSQGGLLNNSTVTTGILVDANGNPLTDANANALGTATNPLYGTQASITSPVVGKTDGSTTTNTSVLTGNGLTVTYNNTDPETATTTVDNSGFSSTKQVTDTNGNVTADHTLNLKNDGTGLTVTDNQSGASTTVTSAGVNTNGSVVIQGTDVKATLDQHTTDIAANTAAIAQEVNDRQVADQVLQNNIDAEAATRAVADTALNGRVDQEVADRAAADTALNGRVDQEISDRTAAIANEVAARQAGDTAIRNDIATKVTTNELEVNGPSTFNGPVTVNNVQSSVVNAQPTVAGKDIVVPTVNQPWANTTQTISSERVDSQEQTRNETKQVYNKDLLQFSSAIVEGTLETTTSQTATATYDANGVIVPGSLQGPTLGQPTSEFKEKSTSSIQEVALGRKDINDDLSLTVTKTANGKTSTSSLSATGISTSRINGNGTNGALVLHGGTNSTTQTLDDNGVTFVTTDAGGMVTGTTTIGADGTLTVKGVDVTQAIDTATTDRGAIRTEFAAADTAIRSEMATETVRVNNAIASGDAATLASANANTATTATAIRGEAATEKTRVNGQLAAATTDRAAIRTEFAAADTAIRGEMATETTRVNKAMSDGNSATLAAANANTATTATAIRSEMTAGNASTLASANKYTDGRVNQLRSKLDDVEQTAYRGVAIALAAQQAIPNLKPGNVAVFGGVGHYEGETAGALGLATLLGDGRTSLSAALGFAESQIGGRVGVSYVFGD